MHPTITSLQNPAIRNLLLLLEKPRARREQQRIVIEGLRESRLALAGGFTLTDVFVCPDIVPPGEWEDLTKRIPARVRITAVAVNVFNRLVYRDDSGGVLALAEPKMTQLTDLQLPESPLLLVLETVEKPGNLGALLRTADAAGLDAVVICDPQTEVYNPNAIRSSVGCVFTLPVVTASSEEAIRWLKNAGIRIFATALTATHFYHETDFRGASAIVMGSEAHGLSRIWQEEADQSVKIPMRGKIDSMNVSVSAAIVVFEAMRQRGFR